MAGVAPAGKRRRPGGPDREFSRSFGAELVWEADGLLLLLEPLDRRSGSAFRNPPISRLGLCLAGAFGWRLPAQSVRPGTRRDRTDGTIFGRRRNTCAAVRNGQSRGRRV